MVSWKLPDPLQRRGDLVSSTWWWIKDRLAMVVRGREGQMVLGMQRKEWLQGSNREHAVILCPHLSRKITQFV